MNWWCLWRYRFHNLLGSVKFSQVQLLTYSTWATTFASRGFVCCPSGALKVAPVGCNPDFLSFFFGSPACQSRNDFRNWKSFIFIQGEKRQSLCLPCKKLGRPLFTNGVRQEMRCMGMVKMGRNMIGICEVTWSKDAWDGHSCFWWPVMACSIHTISLPNQHILTSQRKQMVTSEFSSYLVFSWISMVV